MKYGHWFKLMVVCLGLFFATTGCGMKKQVRYTSGAPNVAVSASSLGHATAPQSSQVSYSHNTRYIQINEMSP